MEEKQLILLVDDNPANLKGAQTILVNAGYSVAATLSGAQALKFMEKKTPDIILLDINMPEMDGFETLDKIRELENGKSVPIVFLTADTDSATEVKCFKVGALDFVGKPFVAEVLLGRVDRILTIENYRKNLEKMVEQKANELTRIQENVINGIANVIESRDGSTGAHVKNTVAYVQALVNALQRRNYRPDVLTPSYAANTVRATVLHDVGKVKISDIILRKPEKLTDDEYSEMKMHAVYGGEIMKELIGSVTDDNYYEVARDIARHHHERWDGTGYPDGVKGEDIPLCSRIVAIADVYDALYSERYYKHGMPTDKVLEIMKENSGIQFDPELIDVFLSIRDEIAMIGENSYKFC